MGVKMGVEMGWGCPLSMHSDAISMHSEAISMHSVVISGHQWSSVAISWQSPVMGCPLSLIVAE